MCVRFQALTQVNACFFVKKSIRASFLNEKNTRPKTSVFQVSSPTADKDSRILKGFLATETKKCHMQLF